MRPSASAILEKAFRSTMVEMDEVAVKTDITQTPAFKAWFGKSKVVDKNGRPLRVYHGTDAEDDFSEFKPHLSDMGIHFGTSGSANQRLEDGGNKSGSRIIPVYLRIEKPLRTKDAWWTCDSMESIFEVLSPHLKPEDRKQLYADMYDDNMSTKEVFDQFTVALEKVGYDGIVYSNKGEDVGSDSYMVWEPTQVKSAIGNKGTFNPIDPALTEDAKPSEVTLVQKILDDPKMPAVAEKGMGYIVHWADGRAIFAVRKKANLMPWLKKAGEMAEVVSIKYGKAEHKGKPLKVEAETLPSSEDRFGRDQCLMFASAISDLTGWLVKGEYTTEGTLIHAWAVSSEGKAVDVWGIHKTDYAERPDWSDFSYLDDNKIKKIDRALLRPKTEKEKEAYKQAVEVLKRIPERYGINKTESKVTEAAHIPGLILEEVFTAKDLDLDKTYGTFKASYEKQTGKAWDKAKFLERIQNWTLYGQQDGFVAARQQASGPIKLVGAAGNPIGVKKGFQEVLAAGKPVWGAMDLRLASLAARMGLKMPPAWLMVRILTAIKDRFAQASGLDPGAVRVNKDGSLTITYPDIGEATKFIVGNKMYFEWLLKMHGSALPAMLRTAISYFLTTGKPPPQPAEQDEEPFALDDKPPVPPTPPDTEVTDAPPQEAVQR